LPTARIFNDDVNTYNIRIQQLPDVSSRIDAPSHRDLFKVMRSRQDVDVKMT